MSFGWCYFKKGILGSAGRNHYLREGEWKSICGRWVVWPHEQKYVHFVKTKEDLLSNKVCQKCLNSLERNAALQKRSTELGVEL